MRRQLQRFHTFKERFRLEDHPLAAAKWAVIYSTMAIAGERPQIAYFDLDQPGCARPANDSVIQRPAKKIRENRDNVDLHKTLNHRGHRVTQRKISALLCEPLCPLWLMLLLLPLFLFR